MDNRIKICVGNVTDTCEGVEIYFDADADDITMLRHSCVEEITECSRAYPVFGENGEKILFLLPTVYNVIYWIAQYPECSVLEDSAYDMTGSEYIAKHNYKLTA